MGRGELPAFVTVQAAEQVHTPAGEGQSTNSAGLPVSRRAVLCGCAATAVCVSIPLRTRADTSEPANEMLPRVGDFLVPFGDDKPKPLTVADIPKDSPPVMAWGFDPAKNVARDGSRLNLVILQRFDPATLSPEELPRAAEGVVAYSAICTHQQCWVTDWLVKPQVLQCPCHQSEYDPRRGAKHVGGPAPRALPALPLKIADGKLQVAAGFTDRVGGEKPTG